MSGSRCMKLTRQQEARQWMRGGARLIETLRKARRLDYWRPPPPETDLLAELAGPYGRILD